MVASLPTVIRPRWNRSPSIQCPDQVHLRLDRTAMTQGEHARHRRSRMQVDALADLVAQRAGVIHQPWRPGQVLRAAGLAEPLGDPDPQMDGPAAAVGTRLQSAEQDARAQHRDPHPAQRRDEEQEAAENPPPVDRHRPRQQISGGDDVVDQRQPDHPLQTAQRGQRQRQRHLNGLGQPRRRLHHPGFHLGWRVELIEISRQRAQPRMVIQVGDRHLRVALPQRGHQLRRRQRAAAEGVEVGLGTLDRRGEHVAP